MTYHHQLSSIALAAAFVVAILSSAPGCAAIKATEQPGKKDFSVLTPGTPRTHVIAELGAPDWSDERDGATTDVFAVKQGYTKGVKAGRALLHGAADVATVGLWEVVGIPVETLADGTDVQVSVTYDQEQYVESVDVIKGEKVLKKIRRGEIKRTQPAERLEEPETLGSTRPTKLRTPLKLRTTADRSAVRDPLDESPAADEFELLE